MGSEVLVMRNIDKSFPGVHALQNVNLSIEAGEVHALIGENGAGKSTLMKILSGVYQRDGGEILVNGHAVEIDRPEKATQLGISIIYQELNLMPNLSVAENIFVGREKRKVPFLDKAKTIAEAEKYVREVGLQVNVETQVQDLSIAQRQMVEVAKALSVNAKVIIMDEPTSSLTEHEVVILMGIIRKLRDQGTSVVFISHRLSEIFEISDRITVLRDGEVIDTVRTAECSEDALIHMMVGRSLTDLFPKETVDMGGIILEAEHICSGDMVRDVSFNLRKGEILGFAGLVGAGRSELMSAIFGVRRMDSGKVRLDGAELAGGVPGESIKKGLGFVPEDRKLQGLVLGMAVRENATLASLESVSGGGLIRKDKEQEVAAYYVDKLAIKTPGIEQKTENLSGGNQQKVVIAKWLAAHPKVLILDEVTRGIDVGAKKEIYGLITMLVREGVGIILISSELPEILGMSDRIIVMHEGIIKGELKREEATQKAIMSIILREDEKKAG
ncbi:MAG: sugar ABC transporter ATP-binding protein [Treponema sp.]|jgi:ABC-type sugar transport system ATPase subunit|nr:sugar ABC transporter ATP-binding protein [Treponema sp.]